MLYAVPQTDSTTEAAMAALVLRLRTASPKPEAILSGPAWATGTVYPAGSLVQSGGNLYKATIAGTSGTSAPTGANPQFSDGGVTWAFVSIYPDTQLATILARWVDRIRAALGDRMNDGTTLLQWDATLDGTCITLAVRDYLNARGRERKQGVDEGIDLNADEALAFLARCKPGTPEGKRENPVFITSDGVTTADAPFLSGAQRSDTFIERRGGDCGWPYGGPQLQ